MQFEPPVEVATILKRYKRFLADVELASGEVITVHTANTGSMQSCWEAGWKVLIRDTQNPERKYRHTLEMTHNSASWINVNTSRTNHLVKEALTAKVIQELQNYRTIKPEAKVGKSRLDFLLVDPTDPKLPEKFYVEVKNVTLLLGERLAQFPDSVSERGQKHLKELIDLKEQGNGAAMLYVVGREDVDRFAPAKSIDPAYAELVHQASNAGVLILAYQCELTIQGIQIVRPLPVKL